MKFIFHWLTILFILPYSSYLCIWLVDVSMSMFLLNACCTLWGVCKCSICFHQQFTKCAIDAAVLSIYEAKLIWVRPSLDSYLIILFRTFIEVQTFQEYTKIVYEIKHPCYKGASRLIYFEMINESCSLR